LHSLAFASFVQEHIYASHSVLLNALCNISVGLSNPIRSCTWGRQFRD
jgi:hypothetical protein